LHCLQSYSLMVDRNVHITVIMIIVIIIIIIMFINNYEQY